MVDILGEILPEIKQELSKEIVAQIDLNELAIKLYPLLQKIDDRNPQKYMKRHIENMQRLYGNQSNIINGMYFNK